MRESPALKIIELLRRARRATSSTTTRTCPSCPSSACASAPLDEALDGADLAVIVTAHPEVDHDAVVARGAAACSTCAASPGGIDAIAALVRL